MSSWRQRKTWLFILAATGVAAGMVVVDEQGLHRYQLMTAEAAQLRAENEVLAAENARLAREAGALRSNPAVLERAVREELRFIRPGEIIYRLDAGAGGQP